MTAEPPQTPIPTTERLARALEAAGDPKLRPMIALARRGYYDDYLSPLVMPLVQLVADLRAAGHPELAQRVIDGEFDATKEEGDAWASSPEGQAVFKELLASPEGRTVYRALFDDRQPPGRRPKKRKRGRK